MSDKWTDRLSEYLDDELDVAETAALEAHLQTCAECATTLQQLRAVVARADQIVDRPPERDLWAGIAARMAQPAETQGRVKPARRHFSFSIPQLAAASIVLMLLSGGTMYLMLRQPAQRQPQIAATIPGVAPHKDSIVTPAAETTVVTQPAPVARQVAHTEATHADRNYNSAIAELETALAQNRSRLDTATVRVLENNLRIIDNAIAEARTALDNDPGNPYLNRYLDQTLQKKIQLLRRATSIVRART